MTGAAAKRADRERKRSTSENESTRFQVAEIMLNVSGPIKAITLELS